MIANWFYLAGSAFFASGSLRTIFIENPVRPKVTPTLYLAGSVCFAVGTAINMVG